ncbi:alpha/beta hydrolase family protein (macronuclear) [Tetrahymena thermophila SB210]|uniref:Alpha/beta hydrolase family protein n=1 Tax=Tetrahymena thermophila (strain SB210) TaxID=312017 RepID=I7MMW8_TETTS|nr:alpha/beta hydrolase family protein [Tetrahymena thermophila SB210]EAS07115.3 alpha/beta hydrolase family protein [Tetrahymena thermophila SB210]|eukprot:XP_001027357.3 alpha/beta hydrolase family protein [Tetrahymena thermophila SB210]
MQKGSDQKVEPQQQSQLQQSKEIVQEQSCQKSDPLLRIIFVYLIIGFIICLVVAIIVGYYYLCSLFLPAYASTIILIAIILFLLRKATYYILFPGQFCYHRTSLEEKFCYTRIRPIVYRLDLIQILLKCLKKEEPINKLLHLTQPDLKQAKLHIDQAFQALIKLEQSQKLTDLQIEIKRLFDSFLKGLDSATVQDETFTFSIQNIICNQKDLDTIKSSYETLKIEDSQKFNDFCLITNQTKTLLEQIENQDSKLKRKYKNQTEKALGSIEFALAEFSVQNNIKRFQIKGQDNNVIHGLIVYSKKHYEKMMNHSDQVLDQDSQSPTLIFCNGNAGLYEFNYFIDDWTQQVVQDYEINVVFWSYRGYGYSTGSPSIQNVCKDVESVYDYVKDIQKLSKIGVFGTSLGGLVAAHLGAHRKIDFLYVDRSFSCISDIAYFTMFRVFKFVVRFLTNYDLWSPFNYVNANCYKVLSYDPNDEAIGYMSSMMNGVSKSIAQNVFLAQNKISYYQQNDYSMIKNFKGFWNRTCTSNNILDYSTNLLIPLQMQKKLFKTLLHILLGIKKVITKSNQQLKIQQQQNDQEKLYSLKNLNQNKKNKVSTCDIQYDIDESYVLNDTQLISNGDFILENMDSNQHTFINQSISMLKKLDSQDIKIIVDQCSPSRIETSHPQQTHNNTTSTQKQYEINIEVIKYNYTLPNNELELEQIKQSVRGIYTLLDQYDSSGLTLLDCLHSGNFLKFQTFILNLFIWGSYPPVSLTVAENPSIMDHHRYVKAKTSQLINKIIQLINAINLQQNQTNFEKCLQQDLQVLKTGFEAIFQSLKSSSQFFNAKDNYKSPNSDAKSNNATIDAIVLNSGIYQRNFEQEKLNQAEERFLQQKIQTLVGNLLVVQCGHVDPYSKIEELALRNHFRNAGFL